MQEVKPEDKMYVCRHGISRTWKQARRLVEEHIPTQLRVEALMKNKCLYLLLEEEDERQKSKVA